MANINKEQLIADIELVKAAKTDAEVDAIMAKYSDAIAEMEASEATPKKKKATKLTEATTEEKQVVAKVEKGTGKVKKERIITGKYEVYPVNDVFMYRLKASNGEILVTSEIYKTQKGAVAAIDTVIKNVTEGTITVSTDKRGLSQFKLFAANKRLIVVSANYTTEARCNSAAESFKKFATISPVVVLEEDPDHLMEKIDVSEAEKKEGGKLVVEKEDGIFTWKLQATNGQVLGSSDEYKTKANAITGYDGVKEATKTGTFYVVKDKRDMYQYKLYAASGRCVLYGETYNTKAQACSAAVSFTSFAEAAEVVDATVAVEEEA